MAWSLSLGLMEGAMLSEERILALMMGSFWASRKRSGLEEHPRVQRSREGCEEGV